MSGLFEDIRLIFLWYLGRGSRNNQVSCRCHWQVTSPCKVLMGNMCAKNKARQSSTFFLTVWFQSMGVSTECYLYIGEFVTLGGSPARTSSSWKPRCVAEIHSIVLERLHMQEERERNTRDGKHLSRETDARESSWVKGEINSHRATEKLIKVQESLTF